MRSPITGKEMILQIKKSRIVYKNKFVEYMHKSYFCIDSGESFTTTELDESNMNLVYSQYNQKYKNSKGYDT